MSRVLRVVWISGLEDGATADLVRAACLPFGDVRDVSLPLDAKSGKLRGFAFVEFDEEGDANACVENLHGAELLGRPLRVTIARPSSLKAENGGKAVWADPAFFQEADGVDGANDER